MKREEALKVAKPILFNADMVRAILDGRKTVTRRPVKMKYSNTHIELRKNKYGRSVIEKQNDVEGETFGKNPDGTSYQRVLAIRDINPPFKIGDILYVRETFFEFKGHYYYKADGKHITLDKMLDKMLGCSFFKWEPSIHMPKEAARIFLRVTGVRAERLKNIITGDYRTPLNINREGLSDPCLTCTHHNGDCKDFIANNTCRLVGAFPELWDRTVKESDIDKYGWNANPWVWVIEFERMEVAEE